MAAIYEDELTDLDNLSIHAADAEVVTWNGRKALRLVDGLALIPQSEARDLRVDVWIGADGPAYPGVAFRATDVANYELAYAVPHASGLWDALQYDPIFHLSNTWQLYHGPAYQREAEVPMGEWFRLRVDVGGERASFAVGDQPPLFVGRLARGQRKGLVGLWTFRPAHFSGLRISECRELPEGDWRSPAPPEGVVDEWFAEEFGVVHCEPGGVLNLNRHFPISVGEVSLTRQLEALARTELQLGLGFSDELVLDLDGEAVFEGSNTFAGFGSYEERGYAHVHNHSVKRVVSPGVHKLTARLRVTESFGWGLVVALRGPGVRLLPPTVG